ncbi:MAG: phosphate acetyltransferase [Candidatus Coatesbacteria bacterium]|nr:phosphate acetyltransferase [Candidatus Coatesbacteria bacterium]
MNLDVLEQFKKKAQDLGRHLVLPEGLDERMIQAAFEMTKTGGWKVTLIENEEKIKAKARELKIDISGIPVIDPFKSPDLDEYLDTYFNKQKSAAEKKNKPFNLKMEQAREIMLDPLYFGAMMVEKGLADGSLAGAEHATGDVIRAGLQVIGTKPGVKKISSTILMFLTDGRIIGFSDCAVQPDPTAEDLADIAVLSAQTRIELLGDIPKVAMLSFSTKGSAQHPLADKVIEATRLAKEKMPDLVIDGEMQADAALVAKVGQKKCPGSPVAGQANMLIFPDLGSANIGYKLVQRLASAEAIGPIMQGFAKPCNDLSRGCSVNDIISLGAITLLKA